VKEVTAKRSNPFVFSTSQTFIKPKTQIIFGGVHKTNLHSFLVLVISFSSGKRNANPHFQHRLRLPELGWIVSGNGTSYNLSLSCTYQRTADERNRYFKRALPLHNFLV